MRKNYSEDSKFEDVLEHLDGVFHKLRLIVMQEIRNDFIPRNMDSVFIESIIIHGDL